MEYRAIEYHLPMVQVQRSEGRLQFDGVALEPGQALTLRCQPDNPVDANAIAVYRAGEQIGYISRKAAGSLHRQHGHMISDVLDVCSTNYAGIANKKETAGGHELINDSDGQEIMRSLDQYNARVQVHALHVDPIGSVQDHIFIIRQLSKRHFPHLWLDLLWWLVPPGPFLTTMPPVSIQERLVSEQSRRRQLDQVQWMTQAMTNVELTRVELGLQQEAIDRANTHAQSQAEIRTHPSSSPRDGGEAEERVYLLTYSRTPAEFGQWTCIARCSGEPASVAPRP